MSLASRDFKIQQCFESEIKELFLKSTYTAGVAATASLATTSAITLTQVQAAFGKVAHNGYTFKTVIAAAAANPTNTVLVAFTGTAAAIVCTITPNDGTNNSVTPVTVTEANLVELINTGLITAKTPTITDASSLRILNTATGGSTNVLAASGNGDNVTATFASGVSQSMTTTVGQVQGITSITEVAVGTYRITLDDLYYGGLKFAKFRVLGATARNNKFQIKADTTATASSQYLDIFNLVTATATNLNDGDALMGHLELKTVTYI